MFCLSMVSMKMIWLIDCRDAKRNPENRISVLETKSGSTSSANEIRIYFFGHFRQENYIKITKC